MRHFIHFGGTVLEETILVPGQDSEKAAELSGVNAFLDGDIDQYGLCERMVGGVRMGRIFMDRFLLRGEVQAYRPDEL